MTVVGDLKLWDLDTANATTTNIDSTNARRVTGSSHSFSSTDSVLVEAGAFRVSFPQAGSIASWFQVYLREPAVNTSEQSAEEFISGEVIEPLVQPDGDSELVREVQVLANTPREIVLRVNLESNNWYELRFVSGFPVIEVTTFRGTRNNTNAEHHTGFRNGTRWTLLSDYSVVRDDSLQSSSQTSSSSPVNFITLAEEGHHWLVSLATEYKWDEVEDGNSVRVKVTDADVNERRKHWIALSPVWADEGTTSGQFHHHTASNVSKDNTYTVNMSPGGAWRFLFAPTNANGADDVEIKVDGTSVHTEGSALAQHEYAVTREVDITDTTHDVNVIVTDGDASDASYELVWLPSSPTNDTNGEDVFSFPRYAAGLMTGRNYRKEDIVHSN